MDLARVNAAGFEHTYVFIRKYVMTKSASLRVDLAGYLDCQNADL